MSKQLFIFDLDGTLVRSFMREGEICPKCMGAGSYEVTKSDDSYAQWTETEKCSVCRGKGKLKATADDYDRVEVLPRRVPVLRALRQAGAKIAYATNQGGVAFGYQTEDQVLDKLARIKTALEGDRPGGLGDAVYVAMGHPKGTVEKWKYDSVLRKPYGGMIVNACRDAGVAQEHAVYIGDMETDYQAAEAAGVDYIDAEVFFSE